MANTYVLIASNTLGSSAASVTFSSIPQTYTDLVLRMSTRSTSSTFVQSSFIIRLNNSSSLEYSRTGMFGNGSTAGSNRASDEDKLIAYGNGNSTTANTFSSTEIYFPNYTASINKPISHIDVSETNATAATMYALAQLWRNTSAISSISLIATGYNMDNFASGSSFFLYGIKNS